MGMGSQRLLCPTLVARDDELAVLAELLARAARDLGEAVLIGGDAGIGKTALMRRFAESARSSTAPSRAAPRASPTRGRSAASRAIHRCGRDPPRR